MSAVRAVAAVLALVLAAACSAPTPPRGQAETSSGTVCAPPSGALEPETSTTIDVVEHAYFCILDTYDGTATMDTRSLLTAGFAALTRRLDHAGRDLPVATMPALTGDRKADWAAFETTFREITDMVPDLREELTEITLRALVAALDDRHATWTHQDKRHPDAYDGDGYGLGLDTGTTSPLFITAITGGAAQAAGLRPGDVIETVSDGAPFIDGAPSSALRPEYPEARPVRLRVFRQSTGRRWSVTLQPGLFPRDPAGLRVVQSRLLDDVAYVRMTAFTPDSANRVLRAITRLRTSRTLSGVVLDLRGNEGGVLLESTRLLSAFVHGATTGYHCTADDTCQAIPTDDTVDLLHLPLVVLADRGCASTCEHFASAVKDLHLGRLVGTRTAGMISGPVQTYLLANNTLLHLPTRHHLGPDREVIDGIGVAPDHYASPTPEDAATGRDPTLTKGLTLLRP
ncbi:S41 family peptidase [Herbidospora sp. RD11066]